MDLVTSTYDEIPVDTSEIPQYRLNIENKKMSNPLPWKGQFSPELVQALLKRYSEPDMVVLDPFLGSGTVLLEAGRAGIAAYGTEINPAAVILARTYHYINIHREERKSILDNVEEALNDAFPIVSLIGGLSPSVSEDIVKEALVRLEREIHEPLEKILMQTLITLVDFYKSGISTEKVFREWNRLSKFILSLPFSMQRIEACHSDARNIPLPGSSVNLVITSPPYINVHNYHQQYRASMESLQWNLLEVAKSEIGSNRKFRGNRFFTVVQFCLDIAQTISELHRVCTGDARIIFVMGRESNVRGTKIYNGEIVSEIADRVFGCRLVLRQERVFTNRFGRQIYEDILHFSPGTPLSEVSQAEKSREIAGDALKRAYASVPASVKQDIDAALNGLSGVSPSPLFNP